MDNVSNALDVASTKERTSSWPDELTFAVRKRRDPAILDREELFLRSKIEKIFNSEALCNFISKIISRVTNTNSCASNKQYQNFIAHRSQSHAFDLSECT